MPRKGENIYKRKDGRWEGRYRKISAAGTKKRYGYIYGKTYREVKEKLNAAKISQSLPQNSEKPAQILTFAGAAWEWIKNTAPFLKESSVAKYQNCVEIYLIPELGTVSVSALGNSHVEQFRNQMLLKGGRKKQGLSPKYVSDMLMIIKAIQKYTAAQRPDIICRVHSVSVKYEMKPIRVLSEQEQECLFHYLIHSESSRDIGILISMFTGLRIGEICALKWGNINLKEQIIDINKTIQRIQVNGETSKTKVVITAPKSRKSIRQIPIPSVIFDKIKPLRQNASDYVLSGCTNCFVEPRTMQNYFKSVLKKCGIPHATFHTLRHTFATRCVAIGVDVKTLSEILGHANINITLNRYVHPTMEQKRQNLNKLSDLFTVR